MRIEVELLRFYLYFPKHSCRCAYLLGPFTQQMLGSSFLPGLSVKLLLVPQDPTPVFHRLRNSREARLSLEFFESVNEATKHAMFWLSHGLDRLGQPRLPRDGESTGS